ncbi:MAG TPA: hypothetical protein DD795_05120 [Erythrobacter sp.]|nr:hypothetical protein [Erythrobacter sp.]
MILRAPSSWQTITADLALILFLIPAHAAGERAAPPPEARQTGPAETGEAALAVHRPAPGESVTKWLRAAATDERQMATIEIGYPAGSRDAALAEGSRLLDEAERAGVTARLLLAPDTAAGVIISVDYLRRPEDGTNLAE